MLLPRRRWICKSIHGRDCPERFQLHSARFSVCSWINPWVLTQSWPSSGQDVELRPPEVPISCDPKDSCIPVARACLSGECAEHRSKHLSCWGRYNHPAEPIHLLGKKTWTYMCSLRLPCPQIHKNLHAHFTLFVSGSLVTLAKCFLCQCRWFLSIEKAFFSKVVDLLPLQECAGSVPILHLL